MNQNLFKQIKDKLKSEFYSMNDEWLSDCIGFYVDQHENQSTEEIVQFVKVQWQLSDLREINNENGCLPRNLSNEKCIILRDNYILQMEQMYDISTSKYKQIQQIRNIHISEAEPTESEKTDKWDLPKKRTMQLKLTDGLQDIIGIEYSHISKLNEKWLPGFKVMIIGPVKCCRGVLLLEEKTLQGIGGEVESILIPNALENILARALKLPENPDPYNDAVSKPDNIKQEQKPQTIADFIEEDFDINFEEGLIINDLQNKDDQQSKTDTIRTESSTKNIHNIIEIQIEKEDLSNKVESKINTESFPAFEEDCNFQDDFFDNDDHILEMVDEKNLTESKTEHNIIAPFRALPRAENDEIIVINEEDDMFHDVKYETLLKNQQENNISHSSSVATSSKLSSTSTYGSRTCTNQQRTSSAVTGGKRTAIAMSPVAVTLKKGKMDRKITDFTKVITPPEPVKICDFISEIKKDKILGKECKQIRGRVEMFEKLSKKDSVWILEATIVDGTGKMEVSFANEVLQNILGFTVQEFSLKKKQRKNPVIESELRKRFRDAEQKIQTLDALLDLELSIDSKPIVKKITELTVEQKDQIDKRLNYFLTKVNT